MDRLILWLLAIVIFGIPGVMVMMKIGI